MKKASSLMKEQGFENVYHLKGGILKYFEDVPEADSKWQGECFVFDDRVSVKHDLSEELMICVMDAECQLLKMTSCQQNIYEELLVLIALTKLLKNKNQDI